MNDHLHTDAGISSVHLGYSDLYFPSDWFIQRAIVEMGSFINKVTR